MKKLSFRVPVSILILLLTLMAVTPVYADAPVKDEISVDFTVTFEENDCGFPVTIHEFGNITVKTWYDAAGIPTRSITTYSSMKFTWDAGYGTTLKGHVQGPVKITYLSPTERIMNSVGTNGLTIVPGYGPALGSAGNLSVRQMLVSGEWVDVEVTKTTGVIAGSPADVAAACAYLRN